MLASTRPGTKVSLWTAVAPAGLHPEDPPRASRPHHIEQTSPFRGFRPVPFWAFRSCAPADPHAFIICMRACMDKRQIATSRLVN